jgi:hypothetical protein
MSPATFPKRRSDGTFCVEVTVVIESDDPSSLGEAIQRWILNDWAPQHEIWTRSWSNGTQERLHYGQEFSAPPHIVKCEGSEMRFRLQGKNSAKLWKDWLVSRLIPDIKQQFPEIGQFQSIHDCE